MARNVNAQVAGGEIKQFNGVDTVADVRAKLSLADDYTATVNGEVADDADEVESYQHVSFAPKVKGGK